MGFFKRLRLLQQGNLTVDVQDLSNALQVLLKRRSIRRFSDKEVPEDSLRVILEAGRMAPSSVNMQTWSFVVFNRKEWRETFGQPIPFGASHAIVICSDLHRIYRLLGDLERAPLLLFTMAVFNTGLAAMNMTVAAELQGIQSIMLSETGRTGILDAAFLQKKLDLPDHVLALTTLALGYARGPVSGIPPRFPWNHTVHRLRYKQPPQEELEEWLKTMRLGYQLTNLGGSFDKKIAYYVKRFAEVESYLQEFLQKEQRTQKTGE
jgi:FMN reductase (NADPH)